ncbi:MAG: hypothetical protein ACEQSX_19225 [Baekduiaceae bacterium]
MVRVALVPLYSVVLFLAAWASGDTAFDSPVLLAAPLLAVAAGYVAPVIAGVLTVVAPAGGAVAVVWLGYWDNELFAVNLAILLAGGEALVALGALLGWPWRDYHRQGSP